MKNLAWIVGGAVAAVLVGIGVGFVVVLVGIGVGFVVAELQDYFDERKKGNNEDDN